MKKKLTLKEAKKKGKLEEFIKQQGKDAPKADRKKFKNLISSVSQGKKKSTQETSDQDAHENCNDTQTR